MKRCIVAAGFQSGKAHISARTITKPSLALEKGKKNKKKVKWNARNNNQSQSSEKIIQKLNHVNSLLLAIEAVCLMTGFGFLLVIATTPMLGEREVRKQFLLHGIQNNCS